MRRLFYVFSIFCMLLLTSNSFAMEIKDVYGVWKGDLANLTGVTLVIHPDSAGGAEISFTDHHGLNLNYGMLKGTYQKNEDGTVTVHLKYKSRDVLVTLFAQLVNPDTLTVYTFWYQDDKNIGSSAGTLKK